LSGPIPKAPGFAGGYLLDLDEILPDSGRAIESDQKLKSRTNDSVIVRFAAGTIVLRRGRRERRIERI
jgi:hypothetical protein